MLQDFLYVQTETIKNTFKNIKHLPVLILHFIAYSLMYTMVLRVFLSVASVLGLIGGIIMYIIRGMIFSHLLYTLDSIINSDRIYYKYLKEGFFKYLSPAITAFFTYYILELVIGFITGGGLSVNIVIMLRILIFLAFSAVAECIYIAKTYSYDSFLMGINIVFENPINWSLIQLLFFIGAFLLSFNPDIFNAFPQPIYTKNLLTVLIRLVFLSVYMLYSGNLFKLIYNTTARKREYMRK